MVSYVLNNAAREIDLYLEEFPVLSTEATPISKGAGGSGSRNPIADVESQRGTRARPRVNG